MGGAVGAVLAPLTEGDPRRVGPYTTVGRLGAGALGPLYAGRADDGRVAAVRALPPELLADPEVKARLAADVAAARTVPGPFAAAVLGADLEAETPWLASALVAGVTLARAVADHGPLPEPALLALAAGVAEALAAMHAAGVMHGDLRPGTVLLTADGPRIVDYALVRAFDGAAEVGIPGFLAPEQARGRAVTSSADMFALGSTLFFATTGRAPFGDGTPEEVKARVAKASPVLGKLPAALSELIRGCFQKDPNSRAQPQQVLEYVQRRAAIPPASGWLPPAVAADVRAAVAEAPEATGGGSGLGESSDANATIIVAPVVPGTLITPGVGAGQQADMGVPFGGGFGAAPGFGASHDGAQTATRQNAAVGGPGFSPEQTGAGSPAAAMPGGMSGAGPHQPPAAGFEPGKPAPSRRNLLLALTGGAAVVVGGGTAVAVGLGGSSGTTSAAANPAVGAPASTAASSAPGLGAPSSAAATPPAARQPLPPTGALPAPTGAVGLLRGPDAAPFWTLPGPGRVTSLAVGEGVLVVCGDSGVSGFDLGGNLKWGPVPGAGLLGSGNGAVIDGVVHVIVASGSSGGPGDLLALNLATGARKWRVPLPQGSEAGVRVGGAVSGTVFLVGTVKAVPFVAAVDAAAGTIRWQKAGVQFATLAVPTEGTQVVIAGAANGAQAMIAGPSGSDTAGTFAAVDIRSGDQVWARPLNTSVDYSRVSSSKAAYVGDEYVLLMADVQDPGSLVGGTVAGGQTTWTSKLPVPPGDAGTLGLITRSPDATSVVALSQHGLFAVEAKSGKVLWQSQGTENFDNVSDSGAPQIADGNVYVHDQKGTWWAVDLATGQTRWRYVTAGLEQGGEPVWSAVPGGVVVAGGGKLALIAARG